MNTKLAGWDTFIADEAECDRELDRLRWNQPTVRFVLDASKAVGMTQSHALKLLSLSLAQELLEMREKAIYYAQRQAPD